MSALLILRMQVTLQVTAPSPEIMKTYLISYDLVGFATQSDYRSLFEYLKGHSNWAKPLQSVWLIRTEKTAAQIRDEMLRLVDSNDKILVIEVKGHWASFNISKSVTTWMKEKLD